jgi:hypothetical protein
LISCAKSFEEKIAYFDLSSPETLTVKKTAPQNLD